METAWGLTGPAAGATLPCAPHSSSSCSIVLPPPPRHGDLAMYDPVVSDLAAQHGTCGPCTHRVVQPMCNNTVTWGEKRLHAYLLLVATARGAQQASLQPGPGGPPPVIRRYSVGSARRCAKQAASGRPALRGGPRATRKAHAVPQRTARRLAVLCTCAGPTSHNPKSKV